MMCSSVLFPTPDGPTIARISPRVDLEIDAPQNVERRRTRLEGLGHALDSKHRHVVPPAPGGRIACALLIADRLHRVEPRRLPGRVERRHEADGDRGEGDEHEIDQPASSTGSVSIG